MAQAADGKVLFFIPDISGFTKFVAETEIKHSRHIIQELLEGLIEANSLGLQVSEIEGDAILFCRPGAPPSPGEFIEQARRMFVGFHTYLKRLELHRICQCGACAGASGLSLKFVAHFGAASAMQVRDHSKFVGTAVIVAHRLLKNSLQQREYLLLTRDLLGASPAAAGGLEAFADGADSYDELGKVEYKVLPLAKYREEVKVEPSAPFALRNPQKAMELSRRIEAPMEAVYQTLIDLPGRMRWIDGIRKVELPDGRANHVGTRHRCVRDGGDPELVTSDVKVTESTMEIWETDVKKLLACRYLLQRSAPKATELRVEFFVRGNFIAKLVFRLLLEKKLRKGFEKSLANLAALCEEKAPGTFNQ